MQRKKIAAVAVCTLFYCNIFLLLLNGCTTKQNTYGVVGKPAISNNGKYIAAVIAESEGTTHQVNGGFRETNYINNYWLKLYETETGKLLKKKKLFTIQEPANFSMVCYGGFDDKIWLYGDGLQAYDINSLEEVADQQKLAAINNFSVNDFPDDQRFIDVNFEKGYINFMSFNRENYRLYLNDLKITKRDPADKGDERSISSILHHDDEYGMRCDTFNNTMFALAKDSLKALSSNLSNTNSKEVNYRMSLFTASYAVKRLGNHDSFTFFNIKQSGSTSYLNPCFLKNYSTGNTIHLVAPEGYLIVHQDSVGSNAKAILTRVDIHHNKIWETATGLSTKISNCSVYDKYCIITANTDYMFSPHTGTDALMIIDLKNGKLIKPALN